MMLRDFDEARHICDLDCAVKYTMSYIDDVVRASEMHGFSFDDFVKALKDELDSRLPK